MWSSGAGVDNRDRLRVASRGLYEVSAPFLELVDKHRPRSMPYIDIVFHNIRASDNIYGTDPVAYRALTGSINVCQGPAGAIHLDGGGPPPTSTAAPGWGPCVTGAARPSAIFTCESIEFCRYHAGWGAPVPDAAALAGLFPHAALNKLCAAFDEANPVPAVVAPALVGAGYFGGASGLHFHGTGTVPQVSRSREDVQYARDGGGHIQIDRCVRNDVIGGSDGDGDQRALRPVATTLDG